MTTENQTNQTEPTRDDLLVAAITAQAQDLIACKNPDQMELGVEGGEVDL